MFPAPMYDSGFSTTTEYAALSVCLAQYPVCPGDQLIRQKVVVARVTRCEHRPRGPHLDRGWFNQRAKQVRASELVLA
jgi:hypothetical protein